VTDQRNDDAELLAVTLENARSIFLARQRAEEELVQARDALAQQSHLLRVTLASIGDGVITTDPAGRVVMLNSVAAELTGWTAAEAQGRPLGDVFQVISERTRQPVPNPAERVLREGRIVGLANHSLLIRRDGTETPIDDSAAPIRDDQGQILGVVLVFRSIAERRRADEALHGTQARLAAIVESSQDAIISKGLDARILSWNTGAERLFGYTAEEIIGQSVLKLIPDDRQDEERMILEQLRRGEQIEHYETVRITKQGRRIDVSLTISPVRDEAGRIVAASKIARDITARKRAARRLAVQNGISRTLADSASLAEAAEGILRLICEQLDWDVGELWYLDERGTRLRHLELYHKPDVLDARFEAASRGRTFERGVGLPGRIWAEGRAICIPDVTRDNNSPRARVAIADGLRGAFGFPIRLYESVLGVIVFFSREVREPDAELVEMMTAVGSQVGQFAERQRAQAALRDADRRKDEFLAMLAHELRNPLAPIRNAVQIVRAKAPREPDLQWATDVVERQIHQMTRLVDDLLDVSRITRGKIVLRRELVDLAAVIGSAVEASRPLVEKWGHKLTVTLPPEPIPLEADATRLAQVFLNLVNNAAKYTDPGGRIAITAERHGQHVAVVVRDSGIGIPADSLRTIFEMFAQVERSIERSEGGLGIGLTLVRRLVEMHGGTVEARSAGAGQGSEFEVRLPLAAARVDRASPGLAPGDTQPRRVAARRILIVDDNQDAADSLGLLLRMSGNDVETAHDGVAAVESATAFRPDIVLMDIGLPRLNGYEAAQRIRQQQGGRNIILVAVTGWGQEEDRRRCLEAGFDHHMTKPVEYEALQRLLAAAVRAP
jgi:PAS domain S-box-containing protein